jgi:uncharacterized protein (TIGR03437 family)
MRVTAVLVTLLAAVGAQAADQTSFVVVSAASSQIGVTPDSLASIFGSNLATVTAVAGAPPWPPALGDMPFVRIMDSAGATAFAQLIYVSPSQMNIWIPSGLALGPATVAFTTTGLPPGVGAAALRIEGVNLLAAAPALFSASGDGTGVAAASAIRVVLPSPVQAPVPVFTCDKPGSCSAVPIDLGIDSPVYLTLYGTGIKGGGGTANTTVKIGDTVLPTLYAGPQPQTPGLDQVNVGLPLSLRGAGLVNVTVMVNGISSNAVQIRIQ